MLSNNRKINIDEIFRLYYRPLCLYALHYLHSTDDAEDVVQDTMIRVWNKRDEWPQFESIEAYCLTVARNLAIDRSQKMEAQNLELTPEAVKRDLSMNLPKGSVQSCN